MRLLHVSDWHLGCTLGRLSRTADHERVLDETVAAARELAPHLIVHSGDVFDHPRPAVDALRRGIETLQRLADVAPVVVLAGNHDSPAMFELFGRMVGLGMPSAHGRVRFVARARRPADGGVLCFPGDDRDGTPEEIRLAPLPFVHPNQLIDVFGSGDPRAWPARYADQVKLVERALADGLTDGYDPARHVLLFAAHLHVGGATWSRSERPLHVSDTYATHAEDIPAVSYAAFGHIHKPQRLPGTGRGEYAGSPLPIDFGEEGERKSLVFVDVRPGRAATVERVELSGGRPLRRVQGTLDALAGLADDVGSAILTATVDTEEPTPDLAERVARLFPRATLLDVHERCATTTVTLAGERDEDGGGEPDVAELFRGYLAEQGLGGARVDRVFAAFSSLLDAARHDDEPTFEEEALFALDDDEDEGGADQGAGADEAAGADEGAGRDERAGGEEGARSGGAAGSGGRRDGQEGG